MRQLIFTVFSFGLLFSVASSAVTEKEINKQKCDNNLSLVKKLRDEGAIQDRNYLSLKELLFGSDKKTELAAKRRALNVNQDKLKERIIKIERYTKNNDNIACITDSAALLQDLSAYANHASGSTTGLDNFVKNWRAKAYLVAPEGPPMDMPPALPPK